MDEVVESRPVAAKGALLARQRAEGQRIVTAWRSSGLSMRAYAQRAGISERRLGLWRRRLEDRSTDDGSAISTEATFVPVTVSDTAALEVVIDERVCIRVKPDCDMRLLARVAAALRC